MAKINRKSQYIIFATIMSLSMFTFGTILKFIDEGLFKNVFQVYWYFFSDSRHIPCSCNSPSCFPPSGNNCLWGRSGFHPIHHGGGGLHSRVQDCWDLCCTECQVGTFFYENVHFLKRIFSGAPYSLHIYQEYPLHADIHRDTRCIYHPWLRADIFHHLCLVLCPGD